MAAAATTTLSSTPSGQKLVEKLIGDLETLVKTLSSDLVEQPIGDDRLDLQKFCAKLEFLLQFGLREKKSSGSGAIEIGGGASTTTTTTTRRLVEYWTMIQDVFKSSRSFDDAVKYVKSLSSELKTNMGRARAFLRFCLQYHRLADAVQQLTMEPRVVA